MEIGGRPTPVGQTHAIQSTERKGGMRLEQIIGSLYATVRDNSGC